MSASSKAVTSAAAVAGNSADVILAVFTAAAVSTVVAVASTAAVGI